MTKRNSSKVFDKIIDDWQVRREVATQKINVFLPVYFSEYLKYKTPNFHEEIFDILEDEKINLAVLIAFRGSAKSTIVSTAFVLWSILGIQQKKFVVICGRTERESKQYLANIKYELEHNAILKNDLGPFDEERNGLGTTTALIIRKLNAKIMISSTEQSIRGMRHGAYRPDLIILDDVEDTASVKTQEMRDKIYGWYTSEIRPAGDKNTKIIAIGNLLHEDSFLKRLQYKIESGEMDGVYREYPVIDENGKPLWPGKYSDPESIDRERKNTGNDIAWAREYLLKIISDDGQMIKREWIQKYPTLPPDYGNDYYAMGVDLAISKSTKADYTSIISAHVFGRGKDLKIYILPNPVNERLTSLETIGRIEENARQLHHPHIFVEDVGYQGSIVEQLKRDNFKAKGIKVFQDKYSRLKTVSQLVESGKVLFPEQSDKNIELLLNQIINFGVEKHDDLADAFSLLLMQILEKDNKKRGGPVCIYSPPFDQGLERLSSREKLVEIEKRRKSYENWGRLFKI